MIFKEITYEEMLPHSEDYRLILHEGQKYYALVNGRGEHLAVCEIVRRKNDIHINCLHVPDEFQGHRFAQKLLEKVLEIYSDVPATAQANDWSIKTFLNLGFNVKSEKQFKFWKAYYVRREANGK